MPEARFGTLARTVAATMSRRHALGGLSGSIVALPVVLARAGRSTAAQGQTTEIGRAPVGQQAFRLVGTIEQSGFDFTAYGFVLQIANLDPAALFTDDDAFNRAAATARLTFQATAAATARAVHHPLFAVDAAGTMSFFVNGAGGASFDEPESFAAGAAVASAELSVHNVVNVQAPQVGIASAGADLVFERGEPFTLGDAEYVFADGLVARLSWVGQGTLLDPELPEAEIRFIGDAVTLA